MLTERHDDIHTAGADRSLRQCITLASYGLLSGIGIFRYRGEAKPLLLSPYLIILLRIRKEDRRHDLPFYPSLYIYAL